MRSFLFSLSFFGLVLLAFNPNLALRLQDDLSFLQDYNPLVGQNIALKGSAELPNTTQPEVGNLPRLNGFDQIPRNDTWIGPTPCGANIFDPPETLPGLSARMPGPLLTKPITTSGRADIVNQPTFLYKSENGVTLKLVQPVVQYYEVKGRRYRDAQTDIFNRQPLKALRQAGAENTPDHSGPVNGTRYAVVADILSPTTLNYTISGWMKKYRLVLDQTVMTSAYLVTLPSWTDYESASAVDQSRWDDFLCNSAHHELGHLRIRLDILAETLDGYASLPTEKSSDAMGKLTVDYRKEINARIQARQDAYHIYNGGGTRRGMTELPYADLPFPWLEKTSGEESPHRGARLTGKLKRFYHCQNNNRNRQECRYFINAAEEFFGTRDAHRPKNALRVFDKNI